MYSSADKVAGQGVGSAYLELMHLLKTNFKGEFDIAVNQYRTSDISHYHTIDLPFWFCTFCQRLWKAASRFRSLFAESFIAM